MFHERLKYLREKENISREHLAKSPDITYSALSKYETGKREPDFEILQKIANFFNVSTDYLLGLSENISPLSQADKDEAEFQAFINDPELEMWYKELPKSDEEELRKLRTIWEMIKNEKKTP